jgi:O-antigen ligase
MPLNKPLPADWAAWLAFAFFALLPFGRLAEIPLSALALALPLLARKAVHGPALRRAAKCVVPLFLCYWLPMLLSSFDSVMPQTSWIHTLAALRFAAAAVTMAVLLREDSVRQRVVRWVAVLLLFWAFDAFVQLLFGTDLLGTPMNPDRLNGIFTRQYQFFGPTLAILSPLLLEYARRHWPAWAWVGVFALTFGAVLIAGMRAGWLMMALLVGAYMVMMLKQKDWRQRKFALAIPATVVVTLFTAYLVSPLFQARLEQTLTATKGSYPALEAASTLRLPIFSTSLAIFRAHPVNGAGVRAFPKAYMTYAKPDDIHLRRSGGKSGASHAHNLVLEVMADTGVIGLAGLLAGCFLAWRLWRAMDPAARYAALPFSLALGLLLFPLNSYFAIYGTYLSSLTWVLFGLWAACFNRKTAPLPPDAS